MKRPTLRLPVSSLLLSVSGGCCVISFLLIYLGSNRSHAPGVFFRPVAAGVIFFIVLDLNSSHALGFCFSSPATTAAPRDPACGTVFLKWEDKPTARGNKNTMITFDYIC
jgi:hypothetical protein